MRDIVSPLRGLLSPVNRNPLRRLGLTNALFKEASLYADLANQVYARGGDNGLNRSASFSDLFDFSRDSDGYAFNVSQTLTEYAVDVPRFEYDPLTTAPKGLLIEPAQTNLLTYSEQFDNAAWIKVRASITADAIAAPDGTLTADKLVEDSTAANTHLVLDNYTFTSGVHTYSQHLNGAERQFSRLVAFDGTAAWSVYTDLENATEGLVGGSPDATKLTALANDWLRQELTFDAASGAGNVALRLATGDTGTADIYPGDGTSGIYAWGAQLVTGPYAGSYIPTGATTATRAADLLEVKPAVVADVVSAAAGTVFIEFEAFDVGRTQQIITLHSTSSGGGDRIDVTMNSTAGIATFSQDGGVVGDPTFHVGSFATPLKFAVTYEAGRLATCLDGGSVDTSTATDVEVDFVRYLIGRNQVNGNNAAANFAKVAYIPRALEDAELQDITS